MTLPLVCLLLLATDDTKVGQKVKPYPRAELLIEASELAKPPTGKQFRILDVRDKAKYKEGHIPNAVWVDVTAWGKAFASGQNQAAWAKRIGELGIDNDMHAVVYDDNLTPSAARVWWILHYWGLKDVRLLNGGWKAWQTSGVPVATDETTFPAREVNLPPRADRLATKDQVLESLKTKQSQIIDTRSKAEYCGEKAMAKRNGAIPGAVHLEWSEVIDQKSQRLKGANELAKLFQEKGIDLNRPAVAHCQSGGRAAVMAFALELMGAKDVRNYYKSWAEWGNADDTPIEKPKP
jgi:thiosulfate/3-mercaptopyruvate sulfurtransferase